MQSDDLIGSTQNLDCFVAVSGAVKTCAVNLCKMANDLRSELLALAASAGLSNEAIGAIREKLEAFSKNELGIHAIQYPRAKLVELAQESISLGNAKWEDRDVQHGNLFAAVAAYKEAIFYLETVDPKPDCIADARRGLEESQKELERRYGDQRFLADRAINLGQWETAQRELAVLLEMIPDRDDARNREASAKLIDVEKRMKGGK